MPVSIAMQRLLRIRELQEEQSRSALQSALRELEQLRAALVHTRQRTVAARGLVRQSVHSGDLTDRIAGLEEERIAAQDTASVSPRIASAEQRATDQRENHLATRVARRQAETLVRKIMDGDIRDEARKSQNNLDEWFRSR